MSQNESGWSVVVGEKPEADSRDEVRHTEMHSPPSVRLFPLYLLNRLTVDLDRVGHDHSSQGVEGQGDRSRSRSWVRLMRRSYVDRGHFFLIHFGIAVSDSL